MSYTTALIEDALASFAAEAAPIRWIVGNEAGDRPARPYGWFIVSGAEAIGTAEMEATALGEQIDERIRQTFEIAVSFQALGEAGYDAQAAIASLKAYAESPSVQIGSAGTLWLGFLRASEIRNLSEVFSGSWEHRAQADFYFSARFDWHRVVDTIAKVDISGAGTTQSLEVPPL